MESIAPKKRRVGLNAHTTTSVPVTPARTPLPSRVQSPTTVPLLAFLEATTFSCSTVLLDRLVVPRVLPVKVESPIVGLLEMEDRYLCQWILEYLTLKDLWSYYRVTRHRINIFRMLMCGRPVTTIPPALHSIFIEMLAKVCYLLPIFVLVVICCMEGACLIIFPGRGEASKGVPLLG